MSSAARAVERAHVVQTGSEWRANDAVAVDGARAGTTDALVNARMNEAGLDERAARRRADRRRWRW
jgi:hypothetical protein